MFEPLYDNILVRPVDVSTSTIIQIEKPRGAPVYGDIVAVGCGYRTESGIQELHLKVKDRVLFRNGDGAEIAVGKEKLLVMKESQVLGKA